MAHRGKFYPVAFRRDWNLNVHTNRIGFAKDYNFYYDSLTVGVWPGLVGAVFVCSEQPQSVPDLLEWASDYMPADGYLWRVRMQQRLTSHAPATEQPSTFVDRSDIGNVYEAVIRTAQPGHLNPQAKRMVHAAKGVKIAVYQVHLIQRIGIVLIL